MRRARWASSKNALFGSVQNARSRIESNVKRLTTHFLLFFFQRQLIKIRKTPLDLEAYVTAEY